jgi:molybdopterin synthase catalytic subunit
VAEGSSPAGAVRLIDISDQPLWVDQVLAAVTDRTVGGIAVFVGAVRDHDGGRAVASLGYEAHPDAVRVLREVAEEIAQQYHPIAIAGVHRIGLLAVGDLAVVTAVACAHRGDAFAASEDFVDQLKARVPIWKRQTFADGQVEWVGIGTAPIKEPGGYP